MTFSTGSELSFCSLHSHCDSVFQQSDQLFETVSAGCHRSNMLQVFQRGCKFSTCGCKFSTCGCKFSHVGASFQLALPRQDEILSPQDMQASDPQLVPSQDFLNCGCKFSHVGASFQLALPRQDEILSPQDIRASGPQLVPNWRR